MGAGAGGEAAPAERSGVPGPEEGGTAATGTPASRRARTPVGKAPILRMLTDERRSTRQVWIAALAAVLVLAIIGGGAIWWHGQSVAPQLQQQGAATPARPRALKTEASHSPAKTPGIHTVHSQKLGY